MSTFNFTKKLVYHFKTDLAELVYTFMFNDMNKDTML